MNKKIAISLVGLMSFLILLMPEARAQYIDNEYQNNDGYITVLKKSMESTVSRSTPLVLIKIKTIGTEGEDFGNKDLHILNRHIGFVSYLIKNHGWEVEYGVKHNGPVDIELSVQERRDLRITAYLYMCEQDKLWNQLIQRGSEDAFYHECYQKMMQCFSENKNLK